MKVGRNDTCPCGSGKKYKKCCLDSGRARPAFPPPRIPITRETVAVQRTDRPIIAAEYRGRRMRAVGSRLYSRPPSETFHEFLWAVLKSELGKDWYLAETQKSKGDRHQVVQWYYDLYDWQKSQAGTPQPVPGAWGGIPSGDVQALTSLSYDIYTLLHSLALPDDLMSRLRDRKEFQGARYEIAVAAMCVRAGCALEYTRRRDKTKRCEFIATHKLTGTKLGIEAKSRRRAGVLHEKGSMDAEAVLRGDVQGLFDDALQQKPPDLPFIIFIDLNSPPSAGVSPLEKKWWEGLRSCFDTHDAILEGKEDPSDPFNAVIVTNFSTHYFQDATTETTGEKLLVHSLKAKQPLPDQVLHAIWEAVNRYGGFPVDPD
jgi:hypothetical protein